MAKATTVDEYIELYSHYGEALKTLRQLITSTELEETLKWSAPVYTLNGKNVLGIGAFKNHFCIWFFNGVFLKDDNQLLMNAQEKTKGLRQMRFVSIVDINKPVVLAYVKEAIENQKLGKELLPERKSKNVDLPSLLKEAFQQDKIFKQSFDSLTPGKQREYAEHIASAKRDNTKHSRLNKIKPMILKGMGLHDKYKNC
ncbi:uncharacterized protein YdeI (YjbR/CyaY-like superfamily) [Gelidibacter sediminis]|uniref:Uncharacterized protein YdeI (YjbR/CyaY-like superfamily) n=1 Tax=Gelidibacter sediminis TaxID=1608710 RepID=A0A4R7PXD8_9FLAO|nr:DUF1801 domain-containing protein [Gelidibacter sediminis]TDU39615.1 uncharacterized protein YdeI (YjbR/CyaY-like superfamily) [Gelidibacter sediminis]